jgi:hypothetical protein
MTDAKWVVAEHDQFKLGAYCESCRKFYPAIMFGGGPGALDQSFQMANECCCPKPCTVCGGTREREYWTICDKCRSAKDAAKEKAAFDAATKTTYNEYIAAHPTWLIYHNDEYYEDLEDCIDRNDTDPPEYVWATTPHRMRFDADDMIEHKCSEMHEDASEDIQPDAQEALQVMLDAWCNEFSPTSYMVDTSLAIVLTAEERKREEMGQSL